MPRAKTLTLDSKTRILLITAEFGATPPPAPAANGAPPARPPRPMMIPGTFYHRCSRKINEAGTFAAVCPLW